jgi:rare lipoprotein A
VSRRTHAYLAAALLGAGALTLPSVGLASSGGAGLGSGGGSSDTSNGVVQPANTTVSASGGGIVITTEQSGFLDNALRFTGTASSAGGRTIEIQRNGHETNWRWANTAHAVASGNGSYNITWNANHIGRFQFRAVVENRSGAHAASDSPAVTATVYRMAIATYYGPGFWGSKTACGQVLRKSTIGVANRTLPCGTPVAIYYNGRTMTVPVIDRGPYANGADWDLTEATATKLKITETVTIGAVSLPRPS